MHLYLLHHTANTHAHTHTRTQEEQLTPVDEKAAAEGTEGGPTRSMIMVMQV